MKVLLRDTQTGLFYAGADHWTGQHSEARDFESPDLALEQVHGSRMAGVEAPALVLHGEEDLIPVESSREWATAFPNARMLVIKGSGHYPHLEAPAAFFAAAECFLAGDWPEGAEVVGERPGRPD